VTLSSAGRRTVGVVIPAAGLGERMGGVKKPWLTLLGEPLLLHTLRPFLEHPDVVAVRIALTREDAADPPEWLRKRDPRIACVPGGATRTASVWAALGALPDVDVVLVHDAARPLVTRAILDRCIAAVRDGAVGAVAGWPASDTLKQVDEQRRVVGTPDRRRLWHAQTPQAFPRALLERAYAAWDGSDATDDAALVERDGGTIVMVEGSATNLKVTRPEDVAVAETLLAIAAPAS
jgi:2-C-methyl-D-erythritol 4-phosphate cytidylyltransferase